MRSLAAWCLIAAVLAAEGDERARAALEVASGITIDGDPSDWAGIYRMHPDPAHLPPARFGITGIAIAPTAEALAICVWIRDRPARNGGAFWLKLDLAGEATPDLILGCYWRRAHMLDVIAADGRRERVALDGIEAELGEVLELRLPWAALAAAVPATLRDDHDLITAGRRDWIRVQAESWSYGGGEHRCRDRGLAVASPVLGVEPSAGAEVQEPELTTAFPLVGRWYCSQGADGRRSHRGQHAYDFLRLDRSHRDHPGIGEHDGELDARYAYAEPIRAGVEGRVLAKRSGQADSPLGALAGEAADNALQIVTASGLRVGFGHLRPGSLRVDIGSVVAADSVIAEVGNSGRSNGPHLHLVASDLLGRNRPLALRDVRVGLNASDDDPWARDLATWIPQAGFFVRVSEQEEVEGVEEVEGGDP